MTKIQNSKLDYGLKGKISVKFKFKEYNEFRSLEFVFWLLFVFCLPAIYIKLAIL